MLNHALERFGGTGLHLDAGATGVCTACGGSRREHGLFVKHVRRLSDEDGVSAHGRVGAIEVKTHALPLASHPDDRPSPRRASTAAHAVLVRALVDWSAALPVQVRALEVAERTAAEETGEAGGALGVRLTVRDHADVAAVRAEVIVPIEPDGWSGLRGLGMVPTGHDLAMGVTRP
ncbi:hypothetical protein SMC26_08525 [Actinomadura fulvescens]|uniref:Uncharacterized protein n=1 Tax=Actinomadura fulvescens TaxID=46160 RepID=A0ABN3QU57_9ACTN